MAVPASWRSRATLGTGAHNLLTRDAAFATRNPPNRRKQPGAERANQYGSNPTGFLDDYVTIERADNEALAEMLQQRLSEADIPCVVVAGNMSAIAGAGASYEVKVPPDRIDEARELLG